MVAISLQQIMEELHVELVVLHDHHGLRLCRPSVKRRAISATAGLAVISLGSVRASHFKRVAAYWVRTLVPRRYGGKRIGGSARQPLGQGMRMTANGHRTEPGTNSLIVPPVARVVLPCSVNERLRSAGQFKGGVSGTPAVVPANAKRGSVPRCAGEAAGAAGNVRRMDSSTRDEHYGEIARQRTTSMSFLASVTRCSPPSSCSRISTLSRGFISAKTAKCPLKGPRKILTRAPRRNGGGLGRSISPSRSRARISSITGSGTLAG